VPFYIFTLLFFIGQRGDNSDIVIWDFNSKRAIFRLSEHDYEVSHIAFSHDDKLLISAGNSLDGKLFIWNASNGHIISSLKVASQLFPDGITAISFGGFCKDVKLRNT
jgi:WD40 repeat protein